jgi:hypothetical protein
MKYLCLICAETVMEQMTADEAKQTYTEYAEFTASIKESGNFLGGNRLKPSSCATTVRVRNGKVEIVDGPFAETREQFGGYYLVDAKNLDEAIRIAARIPGAKAGSVEVRPIADDPQTRALGLDQP